MPMTIFGNSSSLLCQEKANRQFISRKVIPGAPFSRAGIFLESLFYSNFLKNTTSPICFSQSCFILMPTGGSLFRSKTNGQNKTMYEKTN